jgi:hypothetical protein
MYQLSSLLAMKEERKKEIMPLVAFLIITSE